MLSKEDRDYVLGRLDEVHVSTLAERVRVEIFGDHPRSVEACYQPGDGTWYALIFAPVASLRGAPGGGSGGYYASSYLGAGVLVCYLQDLEVRAGGAFMVPPDMRGEGIDSFEWLVNEKTGTTSASALAIAVLLEKIFA